MIFPVKLALLIVTGWLIGSVVFALTGDQFIAVASFLLWAVLNRKAVLNEEGEPNA
jgi:hypothetical protein